MIKQATLVLIAATAILLAGCNSGEESAEQPLSATDRAQARWDHLVSGEYAKAWEYFTPGYRETSTAAQFAASIQQRPVQWQEAVVTGSECEESRCEVVIDVTYSVPSARAGLDTLRPTRAIRETWIRTDGAWWHSPEN